MSNGLRLTEDLRDELLARQELPPLPWARQLLQVLLRGLVFLLSCGAGAAAVVLPMHLLRFPRSTTSTTQNRACILSITYTQWLGDAVVHPRLLY